MEMELPERLNTKINELEGEISRLKKEAADKQYHDEWHWRQIRKLSAYDNQGLPVPRLEIRWRIPPNDYYQIADYGLVYTHLLGHLEFIPFGSTRCGGGGSKGYNPLEMPFRDGAHIKHEMKQLNLPGYVVNEAKQVWGRIDEHGEVVKFGKV